VITIKQIESMRRAARQDGIVRLEILCLEAAEELGHLGNTAEADRSAVLAPSLKAVTREFPHRIASKLGHVVHRQNDSLECSRCGRSGGVSDRGSKGLSVLGTIFTEQCK
jgi:hypothetical protein